MVQDIKTIILSGGIIKFPYKLSKLDWVDEAYIHIYIYFKTIKVIVYIPNKNFISGGLKEYPIDKLDEAINDFFNFVLKKENLAYKMKEAEIELLKEDIFGDLDDEDFYNLVMKKREELIMQIDCTV